MPNTLTSKINSKARILSRILIGINLLVYLLLFISFVLLSEIPLIFDEYFEAFIYFALTSFITSLILVVTFKTVQQKDRTNLVFLYFAFFVINALVILFVFGMNQMVENGLFG